MISVSFLLKHCCEQVNYEDIEGAVALVVNSVNSSLDLMNELEMSD